MKQQLHDYIASVTSSLSSLEDERLSASYIANEMQVSRNLVSQYLNELVNDKVLIKTNTRPVYFYSKSILEELHKVYLTKSVYSSINELEQSILSYNDAFSNLIGGDDSLRHAVEQCKAAVSYPPSGLPILLYGPTGTGKSYLAQLMYDYALQQSIINTSAKFVTVNCSEYANNPELLTANLFGAKKGAYTGADNDTVGLIQVADGGVLFLDEVHCLRAECQEKLFLFMDKGIYHMLGDNETWLTAKTHLVFATTENPKDALLSTMLRRIPLIVTIPSLDDRPVNEKKRLISYMLKQEEEKIKKHIYISNLVYQALVNASYVGNVGSIRNIIKASCANAFLNKDNQKDSIDVHIYNLPDEILQQSPIISTKLLDQQDITMMDIHKLDENKDEQGPLIHLYENSLQLFRLLKTGDISSAEYYNKMMEKIITYNDHVMFDKTNVNNNPRLDFTRKIVDKIFSIVINRYSIKISNANIHSYAKYLYEYTQTSSSIRNWTKMHKEEVSELLIYLEQRFPREYYIMNDVVENIKLNLDIELDDMAKMTLIYNLKNYNKEENSANTVCVILCHGYSTASSLADAANKLIGQYIFDGIDMQLDVSVDKLTEQLNDFLKTKAKFEELVLLVDMGSLEDIYKGIHHVLDSNIAIINNVHMKLVMEIGMGIKQGKNVSEILERAASHNVYSFQYIENRSKKDAILSVCATGMGSAKKISELLITSLPTKTGVEIIPYDFQSLQKNGIQDPIFKRYQVVTIIGTMNPGISEIPFIAVEEIILNNNIDILYQVFSSYLDSSEIHVLLDNMLKNFTLSNIVNHLTILNANKVLEDVKNMVDYMEEALNEQFDATIRVGLYMHLSCLIERLMMRTEIGVPENIDEFINAHPKFINVVKESSRWIEEQYSIEIPISEIVYIYNYIQDKDE